MRHFPIRTFLFRAKDAQFTKKSFHQSPSAALTVMRGACRARALVGDPSVVWPRPRVTSSLWPRPWPWPRGPRVDVVRAWGSCPRSRWRRGRVGGRGRGHPGVWPQVTVGVSEVTGGRGDEGDGHRLDRSAQRVSGIRWTKVIISHCLVQSHILLCQNVKLSSAFVSFVWRVRTQEVSERCRMLVIYVQTQFMQIYPSLSIYVKWLGVAVPDNPNNSLRKSQQRLALLNIILVIAFSVCFDKTENWQLSIFQAVLVNNEKPYFS